MPGPESAFLKRLNCEVIVACYFHGGFESVDDRAILGFRKFDGPRQLWLVHRAFDFVVQMNSCELKGRLRRLGAGALYFQIFKRLASFTEDHRHIIGRTRGRRKQQQIAGFEAGSFGRALRPTAYGQWVAEGIHADHELAGDEFDRDGSHESDG